MAVAAVSPGDSFEAFFLAHVRRVRRYVTVLVAFDLVDDVVSRTFITAWQRYGDIPEGSTEIWLLGVARNHARNSYRTRRRSDALLDAIKRERAFGVLESADPDASSAVAGLLLVALCELGDSDHELMVLVGWLEMTPSEIAVVIGQPAGTVRSRISRLRRSLSERLLTLQADGAMDELS